MMWATHQLNFTAGNATETLQFTSLTIGTAAGPALDKVSILAIPEPSTSLLFLLGLALWPAKKQQALFISLAHNLMRGLEMQLMLKEDIRDQKAMTKRRIRMEKEIKQAEDSGRRPNPLVTAWTRATQRCFQFIRWLRYCLEDSTPWAEALDLLRPLMAKYL